MACEGSVDATKVYELWPMDIKPIKTEADYEVALKEIGHLMDAKPNTPEGDRLDMLTTLVEAWEQKHHRIQDTDLI